MRLQMAMPRSKAAKVGVKEKPAMPAPKGNSFWTMRSSHGRAPIFKDAGQLWSACVEYFEWAEQNPLYEAKAFAYQGDVAIQDLPKMRAMTISGLCIFLDIDQTTWGDYRSREGFSQVAARVDDVIRTQKFEGAAAELLSSNIVARDLGLTDKHEIETKHRFEGLSDEDLTLEISRMMDDTPVNSDFGVLMLEWAKTRGGLVEPSQEKSATAQLGHKA
jgi:hypothetical protein